MSVRLSLSKSAHVSCIMLTGSEQPACAVSLLHMNTSMFEKQEASVKSERTAAWRLTS